MNDNTKDQIGFLRKLLEQCEQERATERGQLLGALSAVQDEALKLIGLELPHAVTEKVCLIESICRHASDVRSAADEAMGRIVDVIVDRGGQVRAAVIDFGGFLGVGSRKIVVDWNALHFGRVANKSDSITLELTKEQVMAAPEYKEDTPIVVLGASGSLQPLQYGQ